MDEATPHLHIDYIPVAVGYKRGLAVQNGYNKALEQMGFVGADGFKQWRERERDVFREICKGYGLNPKEREEEQSRGHTYEPEEYRRMMSEAEDKLQKANEREAEIDAKGSAINSKACELDRRIRIYQKGKEALQRRAEALNQREAAISLREQNIEQEIQKRVAQQLARRQQADEMAQYFKSADKQRDLPYVDIAE